MKHEIDYSCIRADCGGTCFGCTLGICKRCRAMEGGLATECPGVPISVDEMDAIYKGDLDFIDGRWIQKMPNRME